MTYPMSILSWTIFKREKGGPYHMQVSRALISLTNGFAGQPPVCWLNYAHTSLVSRGWKDGTLKG